MVWVYKEVFYFVLHASMLSHVSHVWLCVTLWTVARQAPLPMGILQARVLEWVALPSSRDLLNPGIKPVSLMPPALIYFVLLKAK